MCKRSPAEPYAAETSGIGRLRSYVGGPGARSGLFVFFFLLRTPGSRFAVLFRTAAIWQKRLPFFVTA